MNSLTTTVADVLPLDATSQPSHSRFTDLLWLLTTARLKTWVKDRWLGFWWWLLEPLAMTATYMLMVTFAFRGNLPHFALFLMCAILPWTWFSAASGQAMRSLASNSTILKSTRVNYLLFPTAEVLAATVRFLASLVVLALLMVYYGVPVTRHLAWLPLLVGVQLAFTLGVGYWLALAQVYVEDTSNAWSVVCRVWFFLSPSIYALEHVPASLRGWALINPFAGLFTSYRDVLIDGVAPNLWPLALTLLVGGGLMCSGATLLRRQQGAVPLHM